MELLKNISATLDIEIKSRRKNARRAISPNLLNEIVLPNSKIAKIKLEAEIYEEEKESFREITANELNEVVFKSSKITLKAQSGDKVEYLAPNGKHFTVKDILSAVEDAERQTRANTNWFGGIDVHHVFFEGLHKQKDGSFEIHWGS